MINICNLRKTNSLLTTVTDENNHDYNINYYQSILLDEYRVLQCHALVLGSTLMGWCVS